MSKRPRGAPRAGELPCQRAEGPAPALPHGCEALCAVANLQQAYAHVKEHCREAGFDQILLQARTLGREDNFLHLQCTRAGNELVVLADGDPRYDWLLPAVRQRLREELSQLPCDLAAVESQAVDLSRDGRLRFLGFELRLVAGKRGQRRVHCERLEEPDRGPAESGKRRQGRFRPLRRLGSYPEGLQHLPGLRLIHDAWVNATSIQVGWRHLPLTLYPVVVFLFGWRSPADGSSTED
jgi:hypothetical protein